MGEVTGTWGPIGSIPRLGGLIKVGVGWVLAGPGWQFADELSLGLERAWQPAWPVRQGGPSLSG